jgi:hypothetical protein
VAARRRALRAGWSCAGPERSQLDVAALAAVDRDESGLSCRWCHTRGGCLDERTYSLVAPAPRAEEQLHRLRSILGGDELLAQEAPKRLGRAGLTCLLLQGVDLLGAVKLSVR